MVKYVAGVKGVTNTVTIENNLHDALEKMDIERTLGRNWSLDSGDIEVAVSGTRVILNGTVDSICQCNEAGRIAWNAPGVRTVDNDLIVDYSD